MSNPYCSQQAFDEWTDAPYVTIALSVNGRRTEVEHYHRLTHAPPALAELENLVDDQAGSDKWVK